MQLVDDARRTPVADLEAALQERRRTALVLDAHLRGLAEELVAVADILGGLFPTASLEGLHRLHLGEDVILGVLLGDDQALGFERGLAGFLALAVPAHETLGVVVAQER